MRTPDLNEQLSVRCTSQTDRPGKQASAHSADGQQDGRSEQLPIVSPSHLYPNISTERIMRAVEQQRRISQQLEDLRIRQVQRTVVLRKTGVKLLLILNFCMGLLAGALVLVSIFQPDVLVRLLTWLSDTIAMLIAVADGIRVACSLIPPNSWLFSGAALAIVLLTGMWLRLMRCPQER
jgi:hypothetical protein